MAHVFFFSLFLFNNLFIQHGVWTHDPQDQESHAVLTEPAMAPLAHVLLAGIPTGGAKYSNRGQ